LDATQLAAAAAVSSAYWAKIAAIAVIVGAVGTFLSPLIALQVSRYLDQKREQERRRFELFQVLMQYRASLFLEQPVRALNNIDILFYKNKSVRDAWADCFSSFLDHRLSATAEGARLRQDKIDALLREMAKILGYDEKLSRDDFARVYNPEALGQFLTVQLEQARRAHAALFNQPPAESQSSRS
jgi:hypothetical protein